VQVPLLRLRLLQKLLVLLPKVQPLLQLLAKHLLKHLAPLVVFLQLCLKN
jgi:hypothetical protein